MEIWYRSAGGVVESKRVAKVTLHTLSFPAPWGGVVKENKVSAGTHWFETEEDAAENAREYLKRRIRLLKEQLGDAQLKLAKLDPRVAK